MRRPLLIGMDVDEVLAQLHKEWLRRYNKKYDDRLSEYDIVHWNISQIVKPACGEKIFDILSEPDLYEYIAPFDGAAESVAALRNAGHRVIFISSCHVGTADRKLAWLQRWGFLPRSMRQPDWFPVTDKSLVRADVLVDDHIENIANFTRHSGQFGILITRPHNLRNSVDLMKNVVRQSSVRGAAEYILSKF